MNVPCNAAAEPAKLQPSPSNNYSAQEQSKYSSINSLNGPSGVIKTKNKTIKFMRAGGFKHRDIVKLKLKDSDKELLLDDILKLEMAGNNIDMNLTLKDNSKVVADRVEVLNPENMISNCSTIRVVTTQENRVVA